MGNPTFTSGPGCAPACFVTAYSSSSATIYAILFVAESRVLAVHLRDINICCLSHWLPLCPALNPFSRIPRILLRPPDASTASAHPCTPVASPCASLLQIITRTLFRRRELYRGAVSLLAQPARHLCFLIVNNDILYNASSQRSLVSLYVVWASITPAKSSASWFADVWSFHSSKSADGSLYAVYEGPDSSEALLWACTSTTHHQFDLSIPRYQPSESELTVAQGGVICYDRLLVATSSHSCSATIAAAQMVYHTGPTRRCPISATPTNSLTLGAQNTMAARAAAVSSPYSYRRPRQCFATLCPCYARPSTPGADMVSEVYSDEMQQKHGKSFVIKMLKNDIRQVTLVSPFRPSKIRENVREILVPGASLHNYIPNLFKGKTAGPMALMSAAPTLCSEALGKEEVQALLKEEFDVVLISMVISHCFLSIVHKMQVPFIWVSPAGPLSMTDHMIGNPAFPSFTGFTLLEAKHPLSFTERAPSEIHSLPS
ncbi:hypothetical protein C7M84_017392 [Penaeus vannamei]|uniref:Uncharacterized protein n=1 Tax=Penaeus vannamei TaxID=6689 RepID=A0A423SKL9_PENVA|nr:hypothetical protein C7M84_017392 [Penaeus vannamei]